MKYITRIIFIFCIHMSFYSYSWAQDKTSVFKISPQHFIQNTLKVSLEKQTSANKSIVISPFLTLYDNYNDSLTYSYRLVGVGAEVSKRIYFSGIRGDSASALRGFYAGLNASYGYFNSTYNAENGQYIIDSTYYYWSGGYGTYRVPLYSKFTENIHRVGADFTIGYQRSFWKILYVDVFLGGGIRYSISSRGDDTNFNYDFIDFAYRGVIPKAGINLGIKL